MQGNKLALLPPELTECEKLDTEEGVMLSCENPWVEPIFEKVNVSNHHLFEYLKSSTYKLIHERCKDEFQ